MIKINGNSLTLEDVVKVTRNHEKVKIDPNAIDKIKRSQKYVEKILNTNKVVYGINTGVGELANKLINKSEISQLQKNIIRSHSTGVGEPFSEEIVRGIILLRANALAKGYSGVRLQLIEMLLSLLNNDIYPYIPSQGSVGASGDLAPLSHLALVLIGEGECFQNGKRIDSINVYNKNNLIPLELFPKEGLALINGTQAMTSIACKVIYDSEIALKNAQIAAGMSLEALKGTAKAFDEKIHAVRPHKGQIRCAKNMRDIIKDSEIIKSHVNCEKVQDAYTLRCIPQVYGAILDTIEFTKNTINIEINSATDNPLIFSEENEVISGGNFHGEPIAFAMDFLGIALSEIANISERTIDRMVNPHISGLPPFLTEKSGLNSGMMIAQYTAAALVSENKVLAHPASVDSIPTSAGQEDHVSMGPIAARHCSDILKNVQNVIAIEILCAAQGIDFQEYSPGIGVKLAHKFIRENIKHLDDDRILYKDIEILNKLVINGSIVEKVEEKVKII